MKKIYVNSIQKDSSLSTKALYDKDFLLFFSGTIMQSEIIDILKSTKIESFFIEHALQKKSSVPSTAKSNSSSDKKDVSDSSLLSILDDFEITDQITPSNIAHAFSNYEKLYEKMYGLLNNAMKKNILNYQDIKDYIYALVVPAVQRCPNIYLATNEFSTESNVNFQFNMLLKYMLFSLACSEKLQTMSMFQGIDKRVMVSMSAFLAEIGKLSILQKLNKKPDEVNLDIPKILTVLPSFSTQFLKAHRFPNFIIDHTSQVTLLPNQAKNYIKNRPPGVHDFISLTNYYVRLTSYKAIPHNILKSLIQNPTSFHPRLIKQLSEIIGIIPIGSYVRLRNNTFAIVIHAQKHAPRYPFVQLITDPQGKQKIEPTIISTQAEDFNIVEILNEEAIAKVRTIYRSTLSKYASY